jgi:hypothetical protein
MFIISYEVFQSRTIINVCFISPARRQSNRKLHSNQINNLLNVLQALSFQCPARQRLIRTGKFSNLQNTRLCQHQFFVCYLIFFTALALIVIIGVCAGLT